MRVVHGLRALLPTFTAERAFHGFYLPPFGWDARTAKQGAYKFWNSYVHNEVVQADGEPERARAFDPKQYLPETCAIRIVGTNAGESKVVNDTHEVLTIEELQAGLAEIGTLGTQVGGTVLDALVYAYRMVADEDMDEEQAPHAFFAARRKHLAEFATAYTAMGALRGVLASVCNDDRTAGTPSRRARASGASRGDAV
jgi:hypothetical protein